jgi:hypothetical protein
MSARQDILVSRYIYGTLVHDTMTTGSSVENPTTGDHHFNSSNGWACSVEQNRVTGWRANNYYFRDPEY